MGMLELRGLIRRTRIKKKEDSPKWSRNYVANKATKLSIDLYGEDGEQVTPSWIEWFENYGRRVSDEDFTRARLVAQVLGIDHETVERVLFGDR